jgi:thioredoxin-dependent peroxiredoxin
VILGVSPDSAKSQAKFKAKYALPFTLVADEDHAIAEAYGVWVEKNAYGVKKMGIARTTFLIDPDGRIARVFEKVKAEGHGEEVAEAVEAARK